jgi:hypothetical protein
MVMKSSIFLLYTVFLIGLLFDPDDGDDVFLRKSVDFHRTKWCYIPEDRILQAIL